MVSGTPRGGGVSSGVTSGGPCVRFEGITLELSSFSGCQFDFGKNGSLVLSFDAFSGTVTLQSPSHSTPKLRGEDNYANALPLCSTGSEAGSLGVLDGADDSEAVAMDQSDYDMALSQLEQGDSPKSFSDAAAAAAAAATTAAGSPTNILFKSPSAMRQACEGKQEGVAAISNAPSASEHQPFAALVSPSSSLKSSGSSSGRGGGRNTASSAAQKQQQQQQQQQKTPSGVGPHNGTKNKRSSPAAVEVAPTDAAGAASSTVSPDAATTAAAAGGRPKGKRARRARTGGNAAAGTTATATATTTTTKAKTKAKTKKTVAGGDGLDLSQATASASRKENPAATPPKSQQQKKTTAQKKKTAAAVASPSPSHGGDVSIIGMGGGSGEDSGENDDVQEVMDVDVDEMDDEASVSGSEGGGDNDSDASGGGEKGEGEGASPSSSAAAMWVASNTRASPAPLSRSAKARVVQGVTGASEGGSGPMGRWGHTATMITESTMMVLGGQADDDAHQATLGDLYKFDFAMESWSRPVNCDSIPRAWHTASFIKDKNLLVIFGGERTVDGCPECLDDIMVLDTDIDLLYPPAISGKSPTARSGHSAAIIGTDLVVFGGVRGRKWQNNVAVLDTERWHWRHPTIDGSNPAPRSYHSATVVGNLMVVFGGNNQNESFDKIHVLDTSKSRWVWSSPEVVGVAPPARTGHSAVLLPDGHTILIHGGWDPEDEGGVKNFGDAYLLDTTLWEWSRGPEFLLGADAGGLRVGHTALLARTPYDNNNNNNDSREAQEVAGGADGGRGKMAVAIFGGQDGAGVRRSDLAVLTL